MGKTINKKVILGIVIAAVFIFGILTIDLASADHPQRAGYRFSQFVEDLASHIPVTSADIVDGTIQGVDIATDAVVTIANLIVTGVTTLQGELDMSNNKISNLGTPTTSTDAATKGYVDSLFSCDGAGLSCVVGLGECQNSGINVCVMESAQCSVSAGASSPEICDGLDNDCDGVIDNNLTPTLCAIQTGVCSGSTQTCGGATGFQTCTSINFGPNFESPEVSCDGLDNDCDGSIDEGVVCSVCGNGIVEPGEQCDDGNTNNLDDCTNSCLIGGF